MIVLSIKKIQIQKGIHWGKAPVATVLLIVISCLLYFGHQAKDEVKYQEATDFYLNSDLFKMEYPRYSSYLYRTERSTDAQHVEQQYKGKEFQSITQLMSIDTGFAKHLKEKGTTFWSAREYSQWQALKEKAYAVVSSISAVQFGLIPSHNTPLTFITHQFLHVNLIHLMGTILFLLLLGVPIELALGTGRTFIIYLISGISGGLVYSLAIRLGDIANHFTPYMGASGAIAGLMGMYISIFKLQRIRFIYFFITIGLTTAPALILLPIWFCYEVFQVFYVGIEFRELWAHAGGFIAGATAVLISNKFLPKEEELDNADAKDNHSEYKRELAKVMDCIGNMEFSIAEVTCAMMF